MVEELDRVRRYKDDWDFFPDTGNNSVITVLQSVHSTQTWVLKVQDTTGLLCPLVVNPSPITAHVSSIHSSDTGIKT